MVVQAQPRDQRVQLGGVLGVHAVHRARQPQLGVEAPVAQQPGGTDDRAEVLQRVHPARHGDHLAGGLRRRIGGHAHARVDHADALGQRAGELGGHGPRDHRDPVTAASQPARGPAVEEVVVLHPQHRHPQPAGQRDGEQGRLGLVGVDHVDPLPLQAPRPRARGAREPQDAGLARHRLHVHGHARLGQHALEGAGPQQQGAALERLGQPLGDAHQEHLRAPVLAERGDEEDPQRITQILCLCSNFLPITMRWISEVPSPISSSGASRYRRSISYSLE